MDAAQPSGTFAHLHLHTEYSLLDGGNQIEKLVARVAELGMKACAITDHGNIFGAVAFYAACKEKGIKPILGVEAYVTPPGKPRTDRTYSGGGEGGYHLVLLAENNTGWQNLLKLCSQAYLTGFYYKPRIDRELLAAHSEGLIAINGHLGSEIGEHLLAYSRSGEQRHWDAAVESAAWHAAAFGGGKKWQSGEVAKWQSEEKAPTAASGTSPLRHSATLPLPRFFIELQHHVPEQNAINPLLIRLSRELGLPLVCDNDAHFLRAEDHDAHDTLICISTGKGKFDDSRMHYTPELYVKSPAQMEGIFGGEEYNNAKFGEAGREALANAASIAERCQVELPLGRNNAPAVQIDLPAASALPKHDDPRYAGDMSAWYKDYCAAFELKPFKSVPTPEELAASKVNCDAALRMLAEAGFVWRYGVGESALGGPAVPAGPGSRGGLAYEEVQRAKKETPNPSGFVARDPYPPGDYGPVATLVSHRRALPHHELPDATYFVTWRTDPRRLLDERARSIVRDALTHFDGERCRTYAACVMPDHVHWIVRPYSGHTLSELVKSVKQFTAREINQIENQAGSLWESECWDHIVRDGRWFSKFLRYVIENPAEAGLAKPSGEYPWLFVHPDVLGGDVKTGGDRRATQEADRRARLERELKILADKNISAYFLIVWDFVNWGRQRGIPANARGSGVGTMVGYVLGLSNACPVEFGLLFERFTDPDRTEYPDIDIDLCQDGRGEVINYVRQKYGHVAQIITFGTLKARAAIRDVGRVLEIPLPEVDRIAKLVPEQLNITIEEALKAEPELAKLRDSDERYRQLLDNAIALEGHTRHAGVHAAGVIVATRPLDEIVPLYKQPGNDSNEIITQWDGPTCEKMGLLKMDFLGLRTLSVIERAKKLIRDTMSEGEIWAAVGRDAKDGGPHPLDLERVAPTDPKVFTLFQRAETTGVFQFESGGMRRLLVEMKPDRLEDLIAANALFRPGPMDLIPDYNRRKHGTEEVPKVHEIVDRYTAETYGVMVYQEQVMQIVHGLGGIKLRDAYTLIKNISKKKHDKIEKERPKFVEGAQKQGLSKQAAEELFQLILKFAGYGFNKSHSTGYAIVAYQTAYLKTYFPHQYMAAFLTYESQANKASDWIPYLEDCRRTRRIDPATGETIGVGVEVKPPDINLSMAEFAVVREGTRHQASGTRGEEETPGSGEASVAGPSAQCPVPSALPSHIRFGLKAIKGVGDKAIEAVIVERAKGGPFASLHEFCERMPPGVITKSMLESLITCGAFDSVHGRQNRAAMLGTIEGAMSAGQRLAADKAAGQSGLFGGGGAGGGGGAASAPKQAAPLARAEPWSETETLRREKETLGFYVSSHPLERWRAWGGAFATTTTAAAKELTQDQRVVMAVMVQSARTIVIRNGKNAGQKMGILTVEDLAGACEVVLFADAYVKFQHLAANESVVFVLGRLDLSRGDPQIIADRLVPIDCVPVDAGRLRLFLDETKLNGHAQAALASVAKQLQERTLTPTTKRDTPGEGAPSVFSVEVVLGLQDSVAVLAADPKLRVTLAPAVVQSIEAELGPGMVKVAASLAFEKQEPKKKWERRRGGDDD